MPSIQQGFHRHHRHCHCHHHHYYLEAHVLKSSRRTIFTEEWLNLPCVMRALWALFQEERRGQRQKQGARLGATAVVQVGCDGGLAPSGAVEPAGVCRCSDGSGWQNRWGVRGKAEARLRSWKVLLLFAFSITLCKSEVSVSVIPSNRRCSMAPTSQSPSTFLTGLRRDCQRSRGQRPVFEWERPTLLRTSHPSCTCLLSLLSQMTANSVAESNTNLLPYGSGGWNKSSGAEIVALAGLYSFWRLW